jgi:hypothetical protein
VGAEKEARVRSRHMHSLSCESGEVKERIKEDENRKRKIYI